MYLIGLLTCLNIIFYMHGSNYIFIFVETYVAIITVRTAPVLIYRGCCKILTANDWYVFIYFLLYNQ